MISRFATLWHAEDDWVSVTCGGRRQKPFFLEDRQWHPIVPMRAGSISPSNSAGNWTTYNKDCRVQQHWNSRQDELTGAPEVDLVQRPKGW